MSIISHRVLAAHECSDPQEYEDVVKALSLDEVGKLAFEFAEMCPGKTDEDKMNLAVIADALRHHGFKGFATYLLKTDPTFYEPLLASCQ